MRIRSGKRLKDIEAMFEKLPEEKKKKFKRRKREIDFHTRYKKRKRPAIDLCIECLYDDKDDDKEEEIDR